MKENIFWNNFVALCNKYKKSPNPVAKELGISSGTVTGWKNGSAPRDTAIHKLADYFDVPADYFFVDHTTKTPQTEAEGVEGEVTANDIIALLSDLPDDRVDQIFEWMKVFVQIPEEKMAQALDYLEYLSKSK